MKKQVILFLLSIVIVQNNISADIMTELAKRDRNNPIRLIDDHSSYVLYARNSYLHWRYTGTGGMGMEAYRRTITITISADEFHFHFAGATVEYEYKLADIMWTEIIRPDEDFNSWVEILTDNYKGVSGYLVTGTIIDKIGDYPDTDSIAEYIYIRPDNKDRMFWYNFRITNYILARQR